MIDLQQLNYKDKIVLDEKIEIPKEYYESTEIIELENVSLVGDITLDNENYLIRLTLNGEMLLHDSITYEKVRYPFNVNIEETLENSNKTLDLIEFLWHYIVLEIPIRFTNSELKSIENENYRVISEEEYKKKFNPFSDVSL